MVFANAGISLPILDDPRMAGSPFLAPGQHETQRVLHRATAMMFDTLHASLVPFTPKVDHTGKSGNLLIQLR